MTQTPYFWAALALLALAAAVITLACGAEAQPQDRRFDLEINEGKLNLDPPVIKVDQGDGVTLSVVADEQGTFHLHGYDIEMDLDPGEAGTMQLTADATGKFNITFHDGEEGDHNDKDEKPIASLEVSPR